MARKKAADNNDLQDLVDKEGEAKEGSSEQSEDSKIDKLCKTAIRKLASSNTIWFILIPVSLVLAGAVIFMVAKNSGTKPFPVKNWGAASWIAALTAISCIALAATRISSNGNSLKTFKDVKQYITDGLPEQSDILIRETYFYYCKRRCVHFWLSFGFGALFMLCIFYSILAALIDMAANLKPVPEHVKIHDWVTWKSPKTWTAGNTFIAFGFLGIVVDGVQFVLCKKTYTPHIEAFEEKYGKDQIIDECLYCHRMFKVNFRYKSFAFMIIAFLGCFFYLFTKRFICTMFDKSCTY